uniref:Uncharacterized protein n=1 Tax=Lepeophtheirus salmonis TaxID=72036 RepID=A0A0K2TAJ6_LEPSM
MKCFEQVTSSSVSQARLVIPVNQPWFFASPESVFKTIIMY